MASAPRPRPRARARAGRTITRARLTRSRSDRKPSIRSTPIHRRRTLPPQRYRRRSRPRSSAAHKSRLAGSSSLDNVGVTGYRIERCQGVGCTTFTQVGTSTGTTFSDTGLTAGNIYSYRVRATDAAGNVSVYSIPTPTTGYGLLLYGLPPYGS